MTFWQSNIHKELAHGWRMVGVWLAHGWRVIAAAYMQPKSSFTITNVNMSNGTILLKTQDQFEKMWFLDPSIGHLAGMRPDDKGWIQYHTASWCGPCKRINVNDLVEAAKKRGLTIWKIDVDENEYTSGYCGVRSIPAFQFCVPRKIISTIQESRNDAVVEWISTL